MKDRKDCSGICNRDDDDMSNPCWECSYFCFPIGCMIGEEEREAIYIVTNKTNLLGREGK